MNPTLLFDFSDPVSVHDWAAIDDRVMGGISQSTMRYNPQGHAVFEGLLSLQRNGGFASVRSIPGERGLCGATTCQIEVRGQEKRFKLNLLTDDGFDSLNYQASFATSGEAWQTLNIPITAFRPSFRGREVPGAPPLEPARIRQVGLMIADKQAGHFSLDIRRISLV